MSDMLTKLGIDWKLFIAQLFNFMILFIVLRIFAWKPLLLALEERRAKIKKGITDADKAAKKLLETEKEKDEVLAKARNEAMKIVELAEQKASGFKDEKLRMAREEIDHQLKEAKEIIKNEKAATYDALKGDVARLVSDATGKIVEGLDEKTHQKLIRESIRDLEGA